MIGKISIFFDEVKDDSSKYSQYFCLMGFLRISIKLCQSNHVARTQPDYVDNNKRENCRRTQVMVDCLLYFHELCFTDAQTGATWSDPTEFLTHLVDSLAVFTTPEQRIDFCYTVQEVLTCDEKNCEMKTIRSTQEENTILLKFVNLLTNKQI